MPCFEESKIRTAPAPGAVIVGEGVWEQASFYLDILTLFLQVLFGNFSIPFGKNAAITAVFMLLYLYQLKKEEHQHDERSDPSGSYF